MPQLQLTSQSGQSRVLSETQVSEFGSRLRGQLLREDDPGYTEARTIWNAMIEKRPSLIARCLDANDVKHAVDFARENHSLVSVRGGGHNIAGNALCEGGLMIDLSPMKSVRVNPEERTARVEPGATLGEFDQEAQHFGLATPLGINSTTGVAGLTLGGGFGWLTRKYGLTVDNLISAEVITADGVSRHASARENSDLFWAIRGGGGNFGIVTEFEYRLHPVGPEVYAGLLVYPFAQARSVLRQYREFTKQAPEELAVWAVLRKAPPLPFLPEDVHGREVLVLALMYIGEQLAAPKAIRPLEEFGSLVGKHVGPVPYDAFQKAFDPLLTPGARNYWKSQDFKELSDPAIDLMLEYASKLPSPHAEIFVAHIGGQMNRVAQEATAYPHRNVNYVMNVHGRWESASADDENISWTREFSRAITPHSLGSVYVNFLSYDEQDRIQAAYGKNYDRLVDLKNKYDPQNLFCLNQNIKPGVMKS